MKRLILPLVIAAIAAGLGYFFGYRSGSEGLVDEERARLEADFARSMSGVILEGAFTTEGRTNASPRVERYTIQNVRKLAGDHWVFEARLQFGETDVTLPVPVRVLWAGDTPVVTLTEAGIPGVGTFTARVLFYRDRYAGLWWGGTAGGQQFGRLLRDTPRDDGS